MSNKKNKIVIISLFVLVFVMALGYSAFATKLNISGTAGVPQSWKIGFVNSPQEPILTTGQIATTANGTYTGEMYGNRDGGIEPSGKVTFSDTLTLDSSLSTMASINVTVNQPGDIVEFKLPIKNNGTIDADVSAYLDNVNVKVGNTFYTEFRVINGEYASSEPYVMGDSVIGERFEISVGISTHPSTLYVGEEMDLDVIVKFVSEHSKEAETSSLNFDVLFSAVQYGPKSTAGGPPSNNNVIIDIPYKPSEPIVNEPIIITPYPGASN